MNRTETQDILMVIQAAYPNFKVPDKTIAINTWCAVLDDYTYDQVSIALNAYIRSDTSGFAPSIGQIIEKLQMMFSKEDELNEMAAWVLVQKALRNSGYHAEEEFEKLPPVVQRAIVSPGQLREWATMEDIDGTGMNVMQSNFMRTYRSEVVKEKEMRKLSPDILKLIQRTATQQTISQTEQNMLSETEKMEIMQENAVPMPEKAKAKLRELIKDIG